MVKLPGIQSMWIYKVLIMIILISNFTFSDFLAVFLYDFLLYYFFSKVYTSSILEIRMRKIQLQ